MNTTFSRNSAGDRGGAIWGFASTLTVTNTTFYGNSAGAQGGGLWFAGAFKGSNSIFWGNTAPSYPDVRNYAWYFSNTFIRGHSTGGFTGTEDPLFADTSNLIGQDGIWRTADDGLRLTIGSPLIDTGSVHCLDSTITRDITGAPRVHNYKVDLGAYEYIGDCTMHQINTWTGPVSDNWYANNTYWSLGFAPSACDDVIIPTGTDVKLHKPEIGFGNTLDVQGLLDMELGAELDIMAD